MKIDFYVIPPLKHLDLCFEGNRFFCLAHLYQWHADYRNFFRNLRESKERDIFITLDNGAAEHSLVTEDVLLDIVKELQPHEVIAPDVLFDSKQTIENLFSFAEKMAKNHIHFTKIFACPQGLTREQYLGCLKTCFEQEFVSTIGLSKIAVPKAFCDSEGDVNIAKSRNECVKVLKDFNLLGRKDIHLLGMGEFDEFEYYKANSLPIRSSDSCYSILAAIHGLSFRKGQNQRIPTPSDYFDYELTESQVELAKDNVRYLKERFGRED